MPRVTTKDHVTLHVKDWGTGRPVIMMHGWPLSADTFDDLAMAVAGAGLRAIAYDRRGFGRSEQPWGGYDYDTLADDLGSIVHEYVGAQDATILGFSMGGGEVARYMTRHGGRGVKQAILVASVVPYMLKTADNPKGVDQVSVRWRRQSHQRGSRQVLERVFQGVLRRRHALATGQRRGAGVVS